MVLEVWGKKEMWKEKTSKCISGSLSLIILFAIKSALCVPQPSANRSLKLDTRLHFENCQGAAPDGVVIAPPLH